MIWLLVQTLFSKGLYRKTNIIIFAKLHILFVTWRNWIGLFYVRHFHCRWRVSEWTKNLLALKQFFKNPTVFTILHNFLHGFWRILPKTCCFLCERSYLRLFGISVFVHEGQIPMFPSCIHISSLLGFFFIFWQICASHMKKKLNQIPKCWKI